MTDIILLTPAAARKRLKEIHKKLYSDDSYEIGNAHMDADVVLVGLLRQLGYIKEAKLYDDIQPKWYV